MSTKEPYGMEKDLKVLNGSSKRHSARLEGQFIGIFPIPEMEIIHEGRREEGEKFIVKGVSDPHLKIDLDVKHLEGRKGPLMEFIHLIGLDAREADLDVLDTLEKVLRAFAKARFRNLASVEVDGIKVYENPELDFDLRKVLKNIKELGSVSPSVEEARAEILEHEDGDLSARIKVDRIHTKLGHDIDIRIKGEISGEMLRRIINYLEENLEIEELLGGQ
ncbi:hypothetical protein B6U90_03260 [Thermoplasmatales archaeon ex4484_6]|nr:MAG: hypothetical protein B6U90_03260 [Thermoplasmatales archaeon ex4484_6]RLF69601.1 MAG: hypothetical protein DRN57_00250 [Thermoplasmata archaeon]